MSVFKIDVETFNEMDSLNENDNDDDFSTALVRIVHIAKFWASQV